MALRAAFCAQNQTINAAPVRDAVASLVPNTGGIVQAGDYAVTQTGTPSMGVSVGAGRIWVPGTNVSNISGQTWSTQGQYFIENDAPYTATVATSDPTNPRIDVVYVAMQDSQYSGTSDGPVIAVATGTPAAGATYPTNAPALPANALTLAWINVTANATSIDNAHITQIQTQCTEPFGHCGATGSTSLTSSVGVIAVTAAQVLRGGMTYNNSNQGLVVPIQGLYRVNATARFTGGTGSNVVMELYQNSNVPTGLSVRVNKGVGTDTTGSTSGVISLNAGDHVYMVAYTGAGGGTETAYGASGGYSGCFFELQYVGA